MKKWIYLLLAIALVVNVVAMGVGCSSKAPEKPVVKEEVKPAEAPAPPAPAATPAPAAPEATKK